MARVLILGSGEPTPAPTRFGSSYVLQHGSEHLMFDCGPATTYKLVRAGLRPTEIDRLFFTHHHFDHDVDYPCFLLTRWDQSGGTETPFEVFGPPPTAQLTHRLLDERDGAFAHDWIARVNYPASQRLHVLRGGTLPRKPPAVIAKDIGPGPVCAGQDWEVTAATADHAQPWLESLAYRVDTADGSVVITGDTAVCESVTNLARGADLMLCCCPDLQERLQRAEGKTLCGTTDAARMAQEAGVRTLVLVHVGPGLATHPDRAQGIREIQRIYDGEVVLSEELTSYPVRR